MMVAWLARGTSTLPAYGMRYVLAAESEIVDLAFRLCVSESPSLRLPGTADALLENGPLDRPKAEPQRHGKAGPMLRLRIG